MPQLRPVLQKSASSGSSSLKALLAAGIFIALAAAIFLNRQFIVDHFVAASFSPSPGVVEAGNRAGLNDLGQFYVKVSRTELNSREDFNSACGSLQTEKTVVLGCYKNPEKRIYVYDINDDQLDGIKETSLAHEMLHAAYDRLGSGEKERINRLLESEAKTITDQRLLDVIKHYEQAEPRAVVNELHSIIGTELRVISSELEEYYARYFSNRQAVVALKEKYEKVFTDLADKQQALVRQLNLYSSEILSRQAQYDADYRVLNRDVEAFKTWANSRSATENEFEARRSALQGRIAALNDEHRAIKELIDRYNSQKAELDELNLQATSLNQSIDSSLETVPVL